MIQFYFYFKALHIIAAVAWFAGLFYIGRIFVYHVEANAHPSPKQEILQEEYIRMADRLYRFIMQPAMIATFIFGFAMIAINPDILTTWLYIKLVLVFLLAGYQGFCKGIIKQLADKNTKLNSAQMRFINEIPTLFLIGIVLLAVVGKVGQLNYLYLGIAVVIIGILLFMATRAGAKRAKENQQ